MEQQQPNVVSFPATGQNTSPRTLEDKVVEILNKLGIVYGGGGGHMGGIGQDDERLRSLEKEVHSIKGSLDWAKIAFTMLIAVVIGGFAIVISIILNLSGNVSGVSNKIAEEFRAQRLEQASQVTAISNAITATKQQAPQVILVPAPIPAPTPAPTLDNSHHH